MAIVDFERFFGTEIIFCAPNLSKIPLPFGGTMTVVAWIMGATFLSMDTKLRGDR
jgi:hypothetical protein